MKCTQQKKSTCSINSVRIAFEFSNRNFTSRENNIWENNYDDIQKGVLNKGSIMEDTIETWNYYKFPEIDLKLIYRIKLKALVQELNREKDALRQDRIEIKGDLKLEDSSRKERRLKRIEKKQKKLRKVLNKKIRKLNKIKTTKLERAIEKLDAHLEKLGTSAIFSITNYNLGYWNEQDVNGNEIPLPDTRISSDNHFLRITSSVGDFQYNTMKFRTNHAICCIGKKGKYYIMHDSNLWKPDYAKITYESEEERRRAFGDDEIDIWQYRGDYFMKQDKNIMTRMMNKFLLIGDKVEIYDQDEEEYVQGEIIDIIWPEDKYGKIKYSVETPYFFIEVESDNIEYIGTNDYVNLDFSTCTKYIHEDDMLDIIYGIYLITPNEKAEYINWQSSDGIKLKF